MKNQKWINMFARYCYFCARRYPRYLLGHPIFGIRLLSKRLRYTVLRRFPGDTIISPEGDPIYNAQSLVNHFAIFALEELSGGWVNDIRECLRPVIFDIGSNIGQFGRLAKWINPGSRIFSADPWPGTEFFSIGERHFNCAIGNAKTATLTLQGDGLTGTTSKLKLGEMKKAIGVTGLSLDDMFRHSRAEAIDVLKIDTDGAEFDILQSGPFALYRTKWVIAEVQPESLQQIRGLLGNPKSSRNASRWGGDYIWDLRKTNNFSY